GRLTIGLDTDVYIFWGDNDGQETIANWDSFFEFPAQYATSLVSTTAEDLIYGTTYHYRVYGTNSNGVGWADSSESWRYYTTNGFKMSVDFCGYTGNETLTNFPVLLQLNEGFSGFRYQDFLSSDGHDLRVWDANMNHEIPYTIDQWNNNGESLIWIRVPELAAGTNAVRLTWGLTEYNEQPDYSTNGTVWSEGYEAVYHMNQANLIDVSGNRRDGVGSDVLTLSGGKAGDCLTPLSAGAGLITVSNAAGIMTGSTGETFTLSAWVQDWNYYTNAPLIARHTNIYDSSVRILGLSGLYESGKAGFNAGVGAHLSSATDADDGQWHLVTLVQRHVPPDEVHWDFYIDGRFDASAQIASLQPAAGPLTFFDTPADTNVWNPYSGDFAGYIDEVRYGNVARSSNWIHTAWLNIESNCDFFCTSPVEPIDYLEIAHPGGLQHLSPTEATLSAHLLHDEGGDVDVTIYWGFSNATTNHAAWENTNTFENVRTGLFSFTISAPMNTTIYYRAYAANQHHEDWADTTAFFSTADGDGDGLPDAWESLHHLNPDNPDGDDGASGDPDGDGLSNLDEWTVSTDPRNFDTDGDGFGDGEEVEKNTDPLDP
ncbi:MAG: DUF2341 domain-containing protein, partial [Verrucomicrobiota bacterium]